MFTRARGRVAGVLLVASVLVAACGGDDEDVSNTPGQQGASTSTTAGAGAGPTVTVTGVDYAFQGLPAEVTAGTKVAFVNASPKEVHEFVAIRIPDNERRPVSELVRLPENELQGIFESGPPAAVLVAGPNRAPAMPAVGDGTLSQPGRYTVVCFIPTGADPAKYFEAVQKAGPDGPPDVEGGPPHAVNGMFAEVRVR